MCALEENSRLIVFALQSMAIKIYSQSSLENFCLFASMTRLENFCLFAPVLKKYVLIYSAYLTYYLNTLIQTQVKYVNRRLVWF